MPSVKVIIPSKIKFVLWYLFKSPQRELGWSTLISDLRGILIFLFRRKIKNAQLQPITICTGILNRSHNYLNYVIGSLQNAPHKELIELSIFDCGSSDLPDFEQQVKEQWLGKVSFTTVQTNFSRSFTFNRAVEQASGKIIFLCDADMSLPEDIVEICNRLTGPKIAWFPIYFYLYKNKPATTEKGNGLWDQYGGKGLLACLKEDFMKMGGLSEQFIAWGGEDTDLWERMHRNRFTIIRNKQDGLIHHWHTTHNPKYQYMNE